MSLSWNELEDDERQRVEELYKPPSTIRDLVRFENGVLLPRLFVTNNWAERIRNLEVRKDDIWILSYPKTGTTWTIELVWMLINDLQLETANIPEHLRCPIMEGASVITCDFLQSLGMKPEDPELCAALDDPVTYCGSLKKRRLIKSHLPLEFLPPTLLNTCKVVYVARNPKDTAVSFYHMALDSPILSYKGTLEQFLDLFIDGLNLFGPYFYHLLSGWKLRDHPNVKFLWFEDMKKDQKTAIQSLCAFLEHQLSEDQIDKLEDYINFDNMKKNSNATPVAGIQMPGEFLRKGKVGDWKNHFNAMMIERWEHWIKENIANTGLQFMEA